MALFKKKEDPRSAEELFNIGYEAYQNANSDSKMLNEAFKAFKSAADKGDAASMYYLGRMYEEGDGVVMNGNEAFGYYEKSSDAGYAPAKFSLAMIYLGEEDDEKAFNLFKEASESGDAQSTAALGSMYHEGFGVEADLDEAYRLYKVAYEAGYSPALYDLADMTYLGESVEKDEEKGLAMMREAADSGDEAAVIYLEKIEKKM